MISRGPLNRRCARHLSRCRLAALSHSVPPLPPNPALGGYRASFAQRSLHERSPERARVELGFSAEVLPEVGLPAFATAPLRA